MEAVNVLEHWLLLAEGSRRPGGNTSKKDISFYEEGNQIAGSLLAGWERCESDLKDFCLSHSYSGTVCFVHGAVGWLAGWPPRCSGQQGPHRVGGNVSGRDQLWGSHEDKVPWWTVGKRDPGR